MSTELVLVSGANGYIGIHVVNLLLKEGHKVRGTVRSVQDPKKVESLRELAKDCPERLELVEADLEKPETWKNAVKGCDRVIHVASPLPVVMPTDEQELIRPAVAGVVNVLNAAVEEPSVKRVVLTSSGLTVYGLQPEGRHYSEEDWADLSSLKGYAKSKYLAEKAAWEFVQKRKDAHQPCFEFSVVIPVFVLGPTLHNTQGTSETRFLKIFSKDEKHTNIYYSTCDVRDVALAHVRAAFLPEAVGHRHLISSSSKYIPTKRWSEILTEEFGPKGYQVCQEFTEIDVSNILKASTDQNRMINVLKIQPTDFKSTVIDMANSFIRLGLIKPEQQK